MGFKSEKRKRLRSMKEKKRSEVSVRDRERGKRHNKGKKRKNRAKFKRGRVNLSNICRDGCPSTAENNKNIHDAVRFMIETDKHLTYHEIRTSLGKTMSQIQSILHKHLGMMSMIGLYSQWNLLNLTEAQKWTAPFGPIPYLPVSRKGSLNKAAVDRMGLLR
ncbi:hypothetical protein EVAR_71152_1 [Eumeta japonica]|uniref:Histone-lysine N-methyltransferase SETMAR n=1 Tax=Eumeta variegata TaxID=151549 RepID=A0A4C1T425_EUMVA|nr:hypothetical protein EVAR_71152_1 [Eumeta japonica]